MRATLDHERFPVTQNKNRIAQKNVPRSAARLAAVQALYQTEFTNRDVASVAAEFVVHRIETPVDELDLSQADKAFFRALLSGVVEHQTHIDMLIKKSLAAGWTLERLDSSLRALLRAGTFELAFRKDVPVRVTIDEYVEIASDFYEGDEMKFVNGVLDAIARQERPSDLTARGPAQLQ